MSNEEVFEMIKIMFDKNSNYNEKIRIGKKLKDNNIIIKDLNSKIIIYNQKQRLIVPTIGKGYERKYLFDKFKITD